MTAWNILGCLGWICAMYFAKQIRRAYCNGFQDGAAGLASKVASVLRLVPDGRELASRVRDLAVAEERGKKVLN